MSKSESIDWFGQELTTFVRGQADGRIDRTVKKIDKGRVVQQYPLRVAPRRSIVDAIIYGPNDIQVVADQPLEVGQTVTIITTVTDDIIVMPVVSGADLSRPPTAAGTAGPAGADPNDTTPQAVPGVGGPAGDRVINKALSYLGTTESPPGSNSSTQIDIWQSRWGLSGEPWCGLFCDAMYFEAGVDDEGFGDPYTGDTTTRAKAAGKHRTASPIKGCFAVNGTQHVTLYIGGPIHAADCVGGNQSDSVTRVTYDLRGWDFAVPSALLEGAGDASTPAANTGSAPGGVRPDMTLADWL